MFLKSMILFTWSSRESQSNDIKNQNNDSLRKGGTACKVHNGPFWYGGNITYLNYLMVSRVYSLI